MRGRRPAPPSLRALWNPRCRAARDDNAPVDLPLAGALHKPAFLRGRASQVWDEIAPRADWLASPDAYKLALWACLEAEYERAPIKMTASRISQLRACANDLGLDPAVRARLLR